MIEIFDTAAKALDDITNMGNFRELIIQLVDGGKDRTSAGDLRIRITDHIPGAVVAILNGELHLFLQLYLQVREELKKTDIIGI